jgi:predicted nucleotidyltransferase
MKNRILEKLKQVEKEKNVEILFAVESGSRAWGFASPDSDYDVRFVYRKKKEEYLNLWESKDTIGFMTEDDLDGSGWDLKKATTLLAKSNASLLGWLFSPIIYIDNGGTLNAMKALASDNFIPVSGFYHYHSMNKGFYEQLIMGNGEINIKTFFYAARTSFCANWILQFGSIPPVEFLKLYTLFDEESAELLNALIEEKGLTKESGKAKIDPRLIELIKRIVIENMEGKDDVATRKINRVDFERFFINELA